MKLLPVLAALAAATPLAASSADCSIKAARSMPKAEQMAKATVQDEAARKTAIAKAAPGSVIARGELVVRDGCLVYRYETRVPGKGPYQEVLVDAGNGAVLKVANENPIKERAELVKDKTENTVKSLEGKEHSTKDPIVPLPPTKR